MNIVPNFLSCAASLFLFIRLLSGPVSAVPSPPVLDDPVPATGQTLKVQPVVPAGKSLLLPITAYSGDGTPLNVTVGVDTAHQAVVMARVKTGNPLMELTLSGGTGVTGTMVFQLFRDWTPRTAEFVGGFAQSDFYKDVVFHRLSDLLYDPRTATAVKEEFIYQGGDPGNNPAGLGFGGPGFAFANEFHPALIFTGRGQLAMANSGEGSDYKGTNGSQFFITNGTFAGTTSQAGGPRFLDFKHTILGQLTHGWELLPLLHDTPRTRDVPSPAVKIDSAALVTQHVESGHTYTDAVLVLTAAGATGNLGPATVTVTVEDIYGQQTSSAFSVTVIDDASNSRPFFVPAPDVLAPKDKIFGVPILKRIDLEHDFTVLTADLPDKQFSSEVLSQLTSDAFLVLGRNGYTGTTRARYGFKEFDSSYRGQADGGGESLHYMTLNLGIGVKPIVAKPLDVSGLPATALTDVLVATFVDSNLSGGNSGYAARVNWGDGTSPTSGTLIRDFSSPAFAGGAVKATHTYAKAGIYTMTVDFTGTNGFRQTVRGVARINNSPIQVRAATLDVKGNKVTNGVLANFTDLAPIAPQGYTVSLDWGDGLITTGTVSANGVGQFLVTDNHTYIGADNGETFSVGVRVQKPMTADALAWSRVTLKGLTGSKHLPPFDQAHLVGEITPIRLAALAANGAATYKPLRTTSGTGNLGQTNFTCQMVVINSGSIKSKPGKLHFYLSKDHALTKPETVPGVSDNPSDIAVTIGKLKTLPIPALAPGRGVRFILDKREFDYRLRLPLGEDAVGYNLVGAMSYSDPLADHELVQRAAVEGYFDGIQISKASLTTSKFAGVNASATFTVSLVRKPAADVTINLTSLLPLSSSSTVLPAQADIVPSSLTFVASNWTATDIKTVTVTGKSDYANPGLTTDPSDINRGVDHTYSIQINSVSVDPHFNGLEGAYVQATRAVNSDLVVTNIDNGAGLVVTPVTLTTSGAARVQSFTVKLAKQPTQPVTVAVAVNAANGTRDKASLVFTSSNWNTAQTETVTSVVNPGPSDIVYPVHLSVTSSDPHFGGIAVPDVVVTNQQ